MVDVRRENQKEKEREPGEKEERIKRWPIIPLIGGPIGILILLCYVATAKPPPPVKPDPFANVNEPQLLREVDGLKSQAEQFYQSARSEEDFTKRNELCDKGLDLCDEATEKLNQIAGAYEAEEKKGLLKKGAVYGWERSFQELAELRRKLSDLRGFPR